MTGWGQDGPLRDAPGHDLNYIALAGALFHIGNVGEPPTPPLNLLADFGGGGMLLVAGVLAALVERSTSGEGQVVDAAMVDGVALLMSVFWGLNANGYWTDDRGTNLLDGGAHFYSVYETADREWVSVAAFESKFYAELLRVLELDDVDPAAQMDRSQWVPMKERLAAIFRTRTRDEWVAAFAGREVCFAPVLRMREAPTHPHNVARGVFVDIDGVPPPAPAPRFSRTPPSTH
jgi:alpha-methylacyl-CoA racemase